MVSGLANRKLDVYQAGLELVAWVEALTRSLPAGHRHMTDQLRRASTSIVLNIAEGASEYSRRDKARFYRIALRSATEAAAVLDIFVRIDLLSNEDIRAGDQLLVRIVSMVTRMVRAVTSRERERERERERRAD